MGGALTPQSLCPIKYGSHNLSADLSLDLITVSQIKSGLQSHSAGSLPEPLSFTHYDVALFLT